MYKRTKVIVSGNTIFPHTLLALEQVTPAREADAQMISLTGYAFTCEIELYRYSTDGSKTISSSWERFGWRVIYDEGT